ncbi:MAG: right-handed parallel beta-helix repeat-containing protein [Verrucomicrobiota bacterium]
MRFCLRGGSVAFFLFAAFLFPAPQSGATTYYINTAGDDSNNGLTTNSAWRTPARASRMSFSAGDEILFAAGETFDGKISLDSGDRGTASNPITVSSYGEGRAIISSGTDNGFYAYNSAGIIVSNINFIGAGAGAGNKDGVAFYCDLPGDVKLASVVVENVEVSGFGNSGLSIGSWNNLAGFRDVRIANVVAHDNLHMGIFTWAQVPDAHQNIYIGHCVSSNNFGNPLSSGNTGNGIVLGDVSGGTIERCVAHDNGKNNLTTWEGPVGIWTYDSRNVVIQFNESYSNHTAGSTDGGGFDLDIGVRNSIMQYNYSHDNDGAGYLLCSVGVNDGNIVRYNISQNDGRKNGYSAIQSWGNVSNAEIHNNTVFVSQNAGGPRALYLGSGTSNTRIRNNIFYTTGGARIVDVASGQTTLFFQGNCYYAGGSAFNIRWKSSSYSTFDAWRLSSGQELINTTKTGLSTDPKLTAPGSGGVLNNADLLHTLKAYQLQTGSPMTEAGLKLDTLFAENPGTRDFYGTTLWQGSGADIGSYERPVAVSAPVVPVTQISSPTLLANGNMSFTVTGVAGTINVVQVSSDLVVWSALANIVNVTGTIQFTDTASKTGAPRFYRIQQL